MHKTESILSAGIDIGTSTTKLVISRLILQNTAGRTHVPRIEIIDKEVLYQSPIFKTPLLDEVTIDATKIEQLVFNEYRKANIQANDIQSGAILITGETATKSNASELIHYLSDAAGEFLVATAGPDLESILAARGSGAVAYSKKNSKVIANIDIGGGTTNIAVLKHGEVIGTCTLHVGGRLLEFEDYRVTTIAPSIARLLAKMGKSLSIGDPRNPDVIKHIIQAMVRSLAVVLQREQHQENIPLLLGHVPNWLLPIDSIMFTGGVAQCLYPNNHGNCAENVFDDIGLLLAQALRDAPELSHYEWLEPVETVRATVTGAGMQSTEVSGATIQVASAALPLKNLPVISCDFQFSIEQLEQSIVEAIKQGNQLFDGNPFALYLMNVSYLQFADVERLAQILDREWQQQLLILIIEADYAKVLGQCLLALNTEKEIICIDQIKVGNGDYIDIGNKVSSGVVPVVVKTLAFHNA